MTGESEIPKYCTMELDVADGSPRSTVTIAKATSMKKKMKRVNVT